MDDLIKFRVATEDKAKFEAAAQRCGQSLSDWCRSILLDASKRDPEMVVVDPPRLNPSRLTRGATVKLSKAPKSRVVATIDRDKIDAFQRRTGMATARKR